MSEDFTNGCIVHKDIRHMRLYKDFTNLYKRNEHKVKIVRIMETWTNKKRDEWYLKATGNKESGQLLPEPEFWITMSFQQFRHFMFDTVSLDTIKANLNELIKDKHMQRRVNPDDPYGPPQYLLNAKIIQKALDKLYDQSSSSLVPEVPDLNEGDTPPDFSTPPGKTTPPPGVNSTPTQGGDLPLPRGGNTPPSNNSANNTANNTKDTNSAICETEPLGAVAPSHLTLSEEILKRLEALENENTALKKQLAQQQEQQRNADAWTKEVLDLQAQKANTTQPATSMPTIPETPAVPQQTSSISDSQATTPAQGENHAQYSHSLDIPHSGISPSNSHHTRSEQNEARILERSDNCDTRGNNLGGSTVSHSREPMTPAPASEKSARTRGKKAPAEKPARPEMPPADMAWGTRKCLLLFDAWRGATLIAKYKLMEASQLAKGLADRYSEEQVVDAYTAMEADEYYIERGGADIGDVANNIARVLKKIQNKKNGVRTTSSTPPTSSRTKQEEEQVEWKGQMMPISEARKLGWTGFEKYVGNGPDALEEMNRKYQELLAAGKIEAL